MKPADVQVVIPMSGRGDRYVRAGHTEIKPLIRVDGKPMIEHVVEMYPGVTDFLFVCAQDHLATTDLEQVLRRVAPTGKIVGIEPHKLGPVHAVLAAGAHVTDEKPVLISYCDFSVVWSWQKFLDRAEAEAWDGAIISYRGFHPHSLGPTLYAYLREEAGRVLEIQEKRAFTTDRMAEFASAGSYYFRTGAMAKRYLRKATETGLSTNGEYYASMPYNLLIADSLNVGVYELDQFLQWGTPEDLAEYAQWSDYFALRSELAVKPRCASCTTLIPMAGTGERFRELGYDVPKPLIPVAGRPMLQRTLASLPESDRCVIVTDASIASDPRLAGALPRSTKLELVSLSQRTEGQAATCLEAAGRIDPAEPLLVAPCDCAVAIDPNRWRAVTADTRVDGLILTFRNHPHANRNPRQYGWVVCDGDGNVRRVSCKTPISDTVSRDPGITGLFWFRRAGTFFDSIRLQVQRGLRSRNEYYVDDTVGLMASEGLALQVFDVDSYVSFGTPDDVRTFEYWARYFAGRRAP